MCDTFGVLRVDALFVNAFDGFFVRSQGALRDPGLCNRHPHVSGCIGPGCLKTLEQARPPAPGSACSLATEGLTAKWVRDASTSIAPISWG